MLRCEWCEAEVSKWTTIKNAYVARIGQGLILDRQPFDDKANSAREERRFLLCDKCFDRLLIELGTVIEVNTVCNSKFDLSLLQKYFGTLLQYKFDNTVGTGFENKDNHPPIKSGSGKESLEEKMIRETQEEIDKGSKIFNEAFDRLGSIESDAVRNELMNSLLKLQGELTERQRSLMNFQKERVKTP